MRVTKSSTPVSSSNRNNRQLSENDGTTNGSRDFLRALDSQADMSVEIADGDEGFEASTLTGTRLFLNGHDFHNFVFEFGEEEVDNLEFLDREREEIDFFHGFDFAVFDETAEFGDWYPR